MSRTYKDRPWKFDKDNIENSTSYAWVPYEAKGERYCWYTETLVPYERISHFLVKARGHKTKKKRSHLPFNYNWTRSAPSWFTRMTMNVPVRRKDKKICHDIARLKTLEDIDIVDYIINPRRPKEYYW